MAHHNTTPPATRLEEALTVLFCLIDDAYALLNPRGFDAYDSLKRLSDSEVLTLALFQQLRGLESERSFLREAARFFSHLFPGVMGLHPSSLHRRVRQSVGWGGSSTGAAWVRWSAFSVYGVKLHLICSTNRVPLSYELTAASTADVLLVEELLEAARLENATARKLFGDLAYRSEVLKDALAHSGVVLATERANRCPATRQQVEVCFATLKQAFGMGTTLAKTLTVLASRVAAKLAAYTYGLYINRLLGRPQGHIKELWA